MITYRQVIQFVWRFMRLQKWTFFLIMFLDSLAWTLDALVWPYIIRVVIDIFTAFDGNRMAAMSSLKYPIIGAIALFIYTETTSRWMGFLMAKALPRLQSDIRMNMFDHVQHHSPHYFNERFAGSLSNKITDMTTQVEAVLQQLFWPILPAIAASLLGAVFLWFIHPIFSALLLGWILIHLAITLKFTKKCDLYEHLHGEARSTLIGKIVDTFTNNFAVNLFFRFKHEKKRLKPYQKDEEVKNAKAKSYVERMRIYLSISYFLGVLIVINGTLIYMWLHSKVTTGMVVQVLNTMWSIGMIMWNIGASLPVLFLSFGLMKQAYTVMQDPQDLRDVSGAVPLRVSKGEIVFDNVSFRYGEKQLFKNKHVKIKGGERIGLVGFTGSGKSTFINLILRFFPLHGGKIKIDGQEIDSVTLESLRQQVALIPQDPVLFHRSLRENICYGRPNATEEEMIRAAKLAHCDEFIQNIPKGYEATVGERGTKLSGGEKQRIAIARAILADAPILILDEATSALDSVTESYIQDSLETLMENRTTLVIAHRLSTLARMDRIFVFEKGKIVEEGNHELLLEKNGLYANLWDMQVGGFLLGEEE